MSPLDPEDAGDVDGYLEVVGADGDDALVSLFVELNDWETRSALFRVPLLGDGAVVVDPREAVIVNDEIGRAAVVGDSLVLQLDSGLVRARTGCYFNE